ncbi:peptidoglycan-binding protein [Patulibacter sp. SYSU D01012]|uniref:C40 family peptidase n=1 Tax=Patulibacter sp. SYSU D01012 TaxID=2817381 RepID=UPI001B31818E|nr:peptidoglycan-binding protein [Patulibacter sp. SYSU D01012]
MTARTGELWRLGVPDEEWAFTAPRPGRRDLGEHEVWERSLVRSRLRRESAAARRPGLRRGAKGRIAAALVGVTLAVPATEAVTAGTADAAPLASGLLKRGDSGSAVRALQRALGVAADGEFGAATAKAVRAFQRAHGLQADGVVGALTAAALGTGTGTGTAKASSAAKARGSSASAKGADVDLSAATIRRIQRALGVSADGTWGPQTRKALRAHQRAHGLEVDGIPGPRTLASLGVSATGAHASTADDGDAGTSTGTGAGAAIAAARTKIGAPYASGATGPSSFDCSGLTQWAMRKAGVSLPRTSFAQYGVGSSVSKGAVQAGDLVFFSTAGAGASHVGIATGPSTAISATSHGVMEHSFTSGYWSQHYVGARRVA